MSAPSPATNAKALPEGSKVKLSVVKGARVGKTYSLKDGTSYIGRMGPMQVDVDLTEQEMPGVPVAVNRFALIWFDKNGLGIADTGTRIGTTVNGVKIPKGKRFPLKGEDTLVLAWVGSTPARASGAGGVAIELPEANGRRDGSGIQGSSVITGIGAPPPA